MIILVANLGSTSFKFRLFNMNDESELARGGIDRIGDSSTVGTSQYQIRWASEQSGSPKELKGEEEIGDHAQALEFALEVLQSQDIISDPQSLDAVGFKAVHGGRYSDPTLVNEDVLRSMTEMNELAPAHNPIYVKAIRQLAERFPNVPLVTAFETGFHQSNAPEKSHYAVPKSWHDDLLIRRWGFHGASHRFIAQRMQQVSPNARRVISLHLGGSSSLCSILDGKSTDTTMGMSPQTGLPQSNRCGDFDPFSLPLVMNRTGKTLDEVLAMLANQSGLLGISQHSGDIRDLQEAAENGDTDSSLALDLYVAEIKRALGGLVFGLGGVDAIAFAGGTGENSAAIRESVCCGLSELAIELDSEKNDIANSESRIDSQNSKTEIWIVPTNEEIIVARQTAQVLKG